MGYVERIGFMQGRLTPMENGLIQSFPWENWRQELALAELNDFHLMEWTLDQDRLYENPLLTKKGQVEIKELCSQHSFRVLSLTGDCFMQSPFWKASFNEIDRLKKDFLCIVEACSAVGISMVVVPLVDNGRVENANQEDELVSFLQDHRGDFKEQNIKVVFESDFNALELARFIDRLDPEYFGVNYDIGNSAALGFDPIEEIEAYGHRILNVHIKDRLLGDTTVPLGTGSADFEAVFASLGKVNYCGSYILQTARAGNDDHIGVLCDYRDMAIDWITRHAA